MGLLDWLTPKPAPDRATLELIERAVTAVDPLIRQISGYEHILASAADKAYRYCEDLALAIPGPFEISRAAFADNPLVHALFGSADDISTMLATSESIRQCVNDPGAFTKQHCCALLGMRRRIASGFGTRMTGEIIHRDEPQHILTFADHTLAEPTADIDGAHQRLAMRMFDGLVASFVAHVDEVRAERQELRDAASIERAQARASGPESHTRRLAELQAHLRATADALQPEYLVRTLAVHLSAPENSLNLERLKLWVDRFGILINNLEEREHADALQLVELTTRDQRRWVVMVVKIDRDEALAAVRQFDERRRYIVI